MWLIKGATNLMQRLSRFPAVPDVTLLDRRKPKPFPWPHVNTTSQEQTYIRWCCIDLSNAPRLSGVDLPNAKPFRLPLIFHRDSGLGSVVQNQVNAALFSRTVIVNCIAGPPGTIIGGPPARARNTPCVVSKHASPCCHVPCLRS